MFLDDDDHLLPAALEQLVSAIRGCSSAVAVAGIRIDVSGAERWRPYPHPRRRRLLSIWPELVAGWIPAQGQYLCRTAVARQIGGWNEKVPTAEDVDLWLRLSRAGKILFIPVAVLCVDRSGSGRSHMHDVAAWWKRLRVQFVAELPAPAAELGQRILRAEDLGRGAQQAYRDGRYGRSFLAYLRLWRLVPELMSSPIVGRAYRTALVRAGVGVVLRKRGMGIAKDVAHRLRASS
jgi:GT2 family glycosyltransferase